MAPVDEWLWQSARWPALEVELAPTSNPLAELRTVLVQLHTFARRVGMVEHELTMWTDESIGTAAIEGERLDRDSVRSSVAHRLGLVPRPGRQRRVEGLVDMLEDATRHHALPLTESRLFGWHAALFPTGRSGIRPITVGDWRMGGQPMQVVSNPTGRFEASPTVHFEAPPSDEVPHHMEAFFRWVESPTLDGLLHAALAHLHFLTIHPFDDGNGRIARALTELLFARELGTSHRFWSLSHQLARQRADYYELLESTQRQQRTVTSWVVGFLQMCTTAGRDALDQVHVVEAREQRWRSWDALPLTPRHRKALRKLLDAGPDGFVGGMTNRKYASLCRTSRATAQRDLAQLVDMGVLVRAPGRGRSAAYLLAPPHERPDAP